MERIGFRPVEVNQLCKEKYTVTAAARPGSSVSHDQWNIMYRNEQLVVGFSDGAGYGVHVQEASRCALDASFHFLNTFFGIPKTVEQARKQIELSIQCAALKVWNETRGACTLSLTTFFEGYTVAAWVGDSRVLELNNNYLSPISIPDSLNTHPYWDTTADIDPTALYSRKQQLQITVDSTRPYQRFTAPDEVRMFYDIRKRPGQLLGMNDGSQIVVSSIDRKMIPGHQIIICSDDVCTTMVLPRLRNQLKKGDDRALVRSIAMKARNDATIIRIPIK